MTWRKYWRQCLSANQSHEEKATDIIVLTSRLQLIMATVFSVLSFMPLYITSTTGSTNGSGAMGHPNATSSNIDTNLTASFSDDDYYLNLEDYGHSPYLRQAAVACLIICIIPGVDTLIDVLPPSVTKALFLEEKRLTKGHNQAANIIRLTLAERVMFIAGILCLSILCYPAVLDSGEYRDLFGGGFSNSNTILTTCPILSFLGRTSEIWTPPITLGIGLLVCVASFMNAVILCLESESIESASLTRAQSSIMIIAAGCFVLVSLYSAWRTVRPSQTGDTSTTGRGKNPDSLRAQDKQGEERFRMCVIAFHMCSTLVTLVTNIYWLWFSFNLTPEQLSVLIYTMVAASSLVFVIEGRVRKNEMTRALFALIEAKKSYVRCGCGCGCGYGYISTTSSSIINHHQLSPTITTHHQPSSTITTHHQPSPTLFLNHPNHPS